MIKLLLYFALLFSTSAGAVVSTDGSLGERTTLSGKDYQIIEQLGSRVGNSLFYSFDQFDLQSDEIATFSSSPTVENIFGRITGGSPSFINGTIRTTSPRADLILLNPAGFLFGADAKLDTTGVFTATTADQVLFRDNLSFSVHPQATEILSAADPQAFGFMSEHPAPISFRNTDFNLSDNQFMLLLGGDILLENTTLSTPNYAELGLDEIGNSGIALVSFAGAGQLKLNLEQQQTDINHFILETEHVSKFGHVHLNHSSLKAEGKGRGAGLIYIRGEDVLLEDSEISTDTSGDSSGSLVFIDATSVQLNHSSIRSNLQQGQGEGSAIILRAKKSLGFINDSRLVAKTQGSGQGGTVALLAESGQLELQDAQISTNTLGDGHAGDIYIVAQKFYSSSVHPLKNIVNEREPPTKDNLYSLFNNLIMSDTLAAGQAGHVTITADEVNLGGSLAISSGSMGIGKGGTVSLQLQRGILRQGSTVSSSSFSSGDSGNIAVTVADTFTLDEAIISTGSFSKQPGAGSAGEIQIQAKNLLLKDSLINNSTYQASGGNVVTLVSNRLYLEKSLVSTAVAGGVGNGGNIMVAQPQMVILNYSGVSAFSDAGRGGNIDVAATELIYSSDSVIDASSRLGIDGEISVDSPNDSINYDVFALPTEFLNAESQFLLSCRAYTRGQRPSEFQRPLSFKSILYYGRRAPEDIVPSRLTQRK